MRNASRTLVLAACIAVAARGQTTTGTTATPAATTASSATTAACAAAYGVYGPLSGSSGGSSTPPVSVTQNNTPGSGSGGTPSSSGSGGGSGLQQQLFSGVLPLDPARGSAFDVANTLSGKIAGVTLAPLGPRSLLYTIDPTKVGITVPAHTPKMVFTVTVAPADKTSKLSPDTETILLKVLPPYAHPDAEERTEKTRPASQKRLEITAVELPAAIANESYSAKVQFFLPSGPKALDPDANPPKPNSPGSCCKPKEEKAAQAKTAKDKTAQDKPVADQPALKWTAANLPQGLKLDPDTGEINGVLSNNSKPDEAAIEEQLERLIRRLPKVNVELKVIPLPDGFGHACDIVTVIGHQVPGLLSLAPIDDSRILAGIATEDADGENISKDGIEETLRRLSDLVGKLAVTSATVAPHVSSVTTQLFYDRDAASVATAIKAAFPQLQASPVSTNANSSYASSLILADPTGSPRSTALEQARRMIAQIDEPRPQITVNAWSMQMSVQDEKLMKPLVPEARRFAAGYNDALEKAVLQGWNYLNARAADAHATHKEDFLDADFASYLCSGARWNGRRFEPTRTGICPVNSSIDYGLGYTDIFDRVSPNLVQMLLLVVATSHPADIAGLTLDSMEGVAPGSYTRSKTLSCQTVDQRFYEKYDSLEGAEGQDVEGDADVDPRNSNFQKMRKMSPASHIAFACTRNRMADLLAPVSQLTTTSYLGLFRAAVADFLFQYKMKTEYPDDFEPYSFPQSAAHLDSALTPIMEAFNEDMQALQQHLNNQLTTGIDKDKKLSYTSNGLITVSVISGNQAMVQTQSLNYFPQNPTLKLENFAQQLVQQTGTAATTAATADAGTQTVAPSFALGGSLAAAVPALAALGAAMPQQVTAKVGSGLQMTVTPYALSSDSGAELNVNVQYSENGAATISSDATQSQATDDLNSRVSMHEVNTLVRMDALKFFEVSTLESVIARQRKPYQLVEPLVVLPVLDGLGVFPNWRRKPEVIYNQSIIFLQAAIMPTAADLGNSVRLQYDKVLSCNHANIVKEAHKAADLDRDCPKDPADGKDERFGLVDVSRDSLGKLMEYNRRMVRYFSSQYPTQEKTAHDDASQNNAPKELISSGEPEGLPRWDTISDLVKEKP